MHMRSWKRLAVAGTCAGLMLVAALPVSARGIVSITLDDASLVQFTYGLRLAQAHGIVGTLFVPTARVSVTADGAPEAWRMGWDQIREFHAAGWEIGAHGRNHIRLPGLAVDALDAEISGPLHDIEAETGVRPVSFSSPFGAFDDATIARVMDFYRYHLSWKGHGGRNPIADTDPRYVGRLEVVNTMTAAEVCGEMVRAAITDTWLVLLFHGIVDREPGDYEVSVRQYEDVLVCAERLAGAGVIEVRTVRDAMAATEAAP